MTGRDGDLYVVGGVAPPLDDEPPCRSTHPRGYFCTLSDGHVGQHVAGGGGRVFVVWPAECTRCGHVHRSLDGQPTAGYCNHLSLSGGANGMEQRCPCPSVRTDPRVPVPVDGDPREKGLVFAFNHDADPYEGDS